MNSNYFLGANSSEGFYSLYGGFCRDEGDYLSIIKGGPGTGKSGFMRRIGKAAEQAGFDVEYVLCSGDRASLDGVYIPKLHRGWMDGTSPHSAEPQFFGVDGDYIDLSRFCKTPLGKDKQSEAEKLYKAYKSQYAAAYYYLSAAVSVKKTRCKGELLSAEKESIVKNIVQLLPKQKKKSAEGKVKYRFLRYLSGEGEISLNSEIERLYGKAFTLSGGQTATDYALKALSREAVSRGFDIIVSLSPLEPSFYEAVIIPELETALTDAHYKLTKAKPIVLNDYETTPDECEKTLMTSAYSCLSSAKKQHDALEKIFIKAMDFEALTAFTDSYLGELFTKY